ncbi:peroxisomal targeting signal 2 receptor [Dispira simplex]|nr:peroxisomal targeting signal 2 receptor [Dispira simplex]
MADLRTARTTGYHGYAVKFSPFYDNVLACAGAANFGLVGNGRLTILRVPPDGPFNIDKSYDTQDGIFDCTWNELNEHQIATGGGDGSIKLWDLTIPQQPIMNWREHTREVFSVEWNYTRKTTFLSASWDTSVKLWSPESPTAVSTWQEHTQCVYAASWCPYEPDTFATVAGDGLLKLWDCKTPHAVATICAHTGEALALDWNKYRPHCLATGSVDKSIKLWDTRNPRLPLETLLGHEYAVRRLKFSPHHDAQLASASYDMTARVWDINAPMGQPMRKVLDYHTEFVFGVDFNLFIPGQLATCAWDETVAVVQLPRP